jgi:membrane-bound lytic murein transglycosylase B
MAPLTRQAIRRPGLSALLLPMFFCLLLAGCSTEPETTGYGYQTPPTPYPAAPSITEWVQQMEAQALADHVSPQVVHDALDGFAPNARVVQLDQKQPEGTVTFAAYRHNTVSSDRIAKGADLMHRYADFLTAIEVRTGVPPQIVVALWGIESNYGQNMGSFETVNSLATLAYEGRRADFFRSELLAALHILDQEHLQSQQLVGSWAGAMGQCQFMPSTYLRYAVDGDGDGQRDIWGNPVDVIYSIANYLQSVGWKRDLGWGRRVNIASSAIDPTEEGMNFSRSINEWAQFGVLGDDGQPLSQAGVQASLLQPDGPTGDAYLAYDNVRALMKWNHSTYFALSVGILADQIKKY